MSAWTWIKSVVLAVCVVGGTLYLLVAMVQNTPPPSQPARQPEAGSASPMQRHSMPLPQRLLPMPYSIPRGMRPLTPLEQAKMIDALKARCVQEVKANTLPQIGQQTACQQYATASAAALPPPRPVDPAVTAEFYADDDSQPVRQAPSVSPCSVAPVDDCLIQGPKGSIPNRECRARFKDWLITSCTQLGDRLDHTGGEARGCVRAQKEAYCHAASVYQPIEP